MIKKIQNIKMKPTDPCYCHSGLPYNECHLPIEKRLRDLARIGVEVPKREMVKTKEQVEGIRKSAEINIAVLDYVAKNIKEGISTWEIDRWVSEITRDMGGIPAPLNYEGFPKSVCTSVNDQVCHGIPARNVILQPGDIINVDCSTIRDGYFSDSSRMFVIGETTPEKQRLVDVARECVYKGLEQVKPWNSIGDMAHAIKTHAKANGFAVVRDIGGHGCGLEFHEDPYVSYILRKGTGMVFIPGMCFTIEPMINMGTYRIFVDSDNNWTVYTDDGKPSAQWEIQVLVTNTGAEIITY